MLEFPAASEGVVSLFREGKFGLSFSGKFYIKMENTEAGDPRKVEYYRNFFFFFLRLSLSLWPRLLSTWDLVSVSGVMGLHTCFMVLSFKEPLDSGRRIGEFGFYP